MTTKKRIRSTEKKSRKQKRTLKRSVLIAIMVGVVGFLVFFFLTIFDYVYTPVGGKGGVAKKREREEVVLYFSDVNERFLVPEMRFIVRESDPRMRAEAIVKALIEGPKTGLVKTFPEQVVLKGVKIVGNTVTVDFGRELYKLHPGGTNAELATIYSLTNTVIANMPNMKTVKILVVGEDVPSIKGHVNTRHLLVPNREMIIDKMKEG